MSPTRGTVLITGAAGQIGRMLRTRLAPYWHLRLCDFVAQEPAGRHEDVKLISASMADRPGLEQAMTGADAVVHLGGISVEGDWDEILATNIDGTHRLFEAARTAGVRRVVLASSAHVAGFYQRHDAPAVEGDRRVLPATAAPRPDTYYGVSKAAMEALGSLYADRYGMQVVAIRIGTLTPRPQTDRTRAIWISPDDLGRLVAAAVGAPVSGRSTRAEPNQAQAPAGFEPLRPGLQIVWGTSANARRWTSLTEAWSLGYRPADDSETIAGGDGAGPNGRELLDDPAEVENRYLGGTWTQVELGGWLRPRPRPSS